MWDDLKRLKRAKAALDEAQREFHEAKDAYIARVLKEPTLRETPETVFALAVDLPANRIDVYRWEGDHKSHASTCVLDESLSVHGVIMGIIAQCKTWGTDKIVMNFAGGGRQIAAELRCKYGLRVEPANKAGGGDWRDCIERPRT